MNVFEKLDYAIERYKKDIPYYQTVRDYLLGKHDLGYISEQLRIEYSLFQEKSVTNWLPLVIDIMAQNLFVEGLRHIETDDTPKGWDIFKLNNMTSKQTMLHRSILSYGTGYIIISPSVNNNNPSLVVASPLTLYPISHSKFDIHPEYTIRFIKHENNQKETLDEIWELIDEECIYYINNTTGKFKSKPIKHNFGVCPVVQFWNRYSDDPDIQTVQLGEIDGLTCIQDRINNTALDLLCAQSSSAFAARWATGIKPKPDGKGGYKELDGVASNKIMATSNPDAKFGTFAQTSLNGYLDSVEAAVKHLAAIAQVPPHYLLGGMINISASALAAAEAGMVRKVREKQHILECSWLEVFKLIDNNIDDTRILWHDPEGRGLAAQVDALGKMAQMLDVPKTCLWERLSLSQDELSAWKEQWAKEQESKTIDDLLVTEHEPVEYKKEYTNSPEFYRNAPELLENRKKEWVG